MGIYDDPDLYCAAFPPPTDAEVDAALRRVDDPRSLLGASQVFSLHCPATPETDRFLDADAIEALLEDPIVVNTATGEIMGQFFCWGWLDSSIEDARHDLPNPLVLSLTLSQQQKPIR